MPLCLVLAAILKNTGRPCAAGIAMMNPMASRYTVSTGPAANAMEWPIIWVGADRRQVMRTGNPGKFHGAVDLE